MNEIYEKITSILDKETSELSSKDYEELLRDLLSDIESRLDGLEADESFS